MVVLVHVISKLLIGFDQMKSYPEKTEWLPFLFFKNILLSFSVGLNSPGGGGRHHTKNIDKQKKTTQEKRITF